MTKDEVNEAWNRLTDGGKNDDTVDSLRRTFARFRTELRSRFCVSRAILDEIDNAESNAVHETKWHLLNGGKAPRSIV